MINLIPPNARKQVQLEYWVRVCSVWVILVAVAVVIIGSLLMPSLVLVHAQKAVYDTVYQDVSSQNSAYKQEEDLIRTANAVAKRLASADTSMPFSTLLLQIKSIASSRVDIQTISSSKEEGLIKSIQVSGEASSRSTLVQFRDALQAHPAFDSVALPLSNLAKDKDVPFNVVIMVNNQVPE